jgi:phosphoacetylglucosamine mutase
MKYIEVVLSKNCNSSGLTKGVIVTPYSNSNMGDEVRKEDWEFVMSAPGVKNLHRDAIKYDVGIYFEKNGHGNVHFSEKALKDRNIARIDKLLYSKAGDSIAIFLLTIYAIRYLQITWQDFADMIPNIIQVNDKIVRDNLDTKLLTNDIETEILEPKELSDGIKEINDKFPGNRAVIRPSGTEPIIRLLIEGNDIDLINIHVKELKSYFSGKV